MSTQTVLNCPYCCDEVDIRILAEVAPETLGEVTILEAIVCDCPLAGRAYYQCHCGYQELLDPEGNDPEGNDPEDRDDDDTGG